MFQRIQRLQTKLPTDLANRVGRGLLHAQKNSPHLLFGVGVVGVVATAVLASKATLKLDEVLNDTQKDLEMAKLVLEDNSDNERYTEDDYTKDVLLIQVKGAVKVAKLYAPALIAGGLSVAALTGSHVILTQRNLAVTAAYAALEKGYREYQQRVINELGEDRERELRYETVEKSTKTTVDGKSKTTKSLVPSGEHSMYARFFDEYNKNWCQTPEYNRMFLQSQQNWANELLKARGHVFLNEVYDMLGLDRSKAGQVVGWVNNGSGDGYIDFGLFQDNERARMFVNGLEPSILLDFNVDGVIYDKI